MKNWENFFKSVELFADSEYTQEFGRKITVGLMMTDDKEERDSILQKALNNGLGIDDYIGLKKIWINE